MSDADKTRAAGLAAFGRNGAPRFQSWFLSPGPNLLFLGSGRWQAEGSDPQFRLVPPDGRLAPGPHEIRIISSSESPLPLSPRLYFDVGSGFHEAEAVQLPSFLAEHSQIILLPAGVKAVRLDPVAQAGAFVLDQVLLRRIGTIEGVETIRKLAGRKRALSSLLRGRVGETLAADAAARLAPGGIDYATWLARHEPPRARQEARIRSHLAALPRLPRLSIVTPAYNSNPDWLRQAIASVRGQAYPDWELCIVDDASPNADVWTVLQAAASEDPRIKVQRLDQNGGISVATNAAIALATGEWVAFMDHDDTIRHDALALFADAIVRNPGARILYTDEDKIDEAGRRSDPYMKGGWNRELFYGQNYLNHFTCIRRDILDAAGPLRPDFDGSQDYDLLLRCIERVDDDAILHLPFVCYHWRFASERVNFSMTQGERAFDAGVRALNEHFARTGQPATAERARPDLPYARAKWRLEQKPKISLIIPTRDRRAILETAITSIREKTTYPDYEILVVDNDSRDKATLDYLRDLERRGDARIIQAPGEFNFSRINNIAADQAAGDILGFVNNDIEVRNAEWLDEMASHFARADVGAVGAKLLYPDGRIQHAGVVTGIGGVAGHLYKLFPGDAPGPFSLLQLPRETTCATAACLLVRASIFREVGMFDARNLAVAFNDIDLCLRIRKAGHRIIWTPFAELTHFESVSRGADTDPEKQLRFQGEVHAMWRLWEKGILESDPCYSPNLTLVEENGALATPPRVRRPWE
jgi:O-antigen biosynthesis protein